MARGKGGWGRRTNDAVNRMAARVDDQTGKAAGRAAQAITVAVRLLRIPTAILLVAPFPFLVVMAASSISLGGTAGLVFGIVTALLTLVPLAFGWRRRQIVKAVAEPEALGTELGIMVNLSERADETRGVLEQLAGGGGSRLFSRLRAAWRGVTLPGHWIEGVGDLPNARHFAPPRIGITVSLTIATLWVVLISVVGAVLLAIAALARAL
ncbi:MAG: hypothetical protein QM597_04780 [Aeromicrobium sp.]|uniref:hypothetical protein n=1 Tax=Aeromicrobium sp. TaxID=1871063 RepID=UPI0039E2CF82